MLGSNCVEMGEVKFWPLQSRRRRDRCKIDVAPRGADQARACDLADQLNVTERILAFQSQTRPGPVEYRVASVAVGGRAVRALKQPGQVLADASVFDAAEDPQLEGAFGTEVVARVQINRIVLRLHRAESVLVQSRFRADQIRRPDHLGGRSKDRGVRGGVQMRPVHLDIVGLGRHIAQADAEGGTEVWLERLVVPIGRDQGERGDQRAVFEIAGARLQIHQRSTDLEVRARLRWFGVDGSAGDAA